MSLMVPPVANNVTKAYTSGYSHMHNQLQAPAEGLPNVSDLVDVKFDTNRQEIMFGDGKSNPVRNGEWVVIVIPG